METWKASHFLDDRPTDVIIVLDGCKFFVHKDILMKHCDYFRAMFMSQMSENRQDEIIIKIVDKDPFQILIRGFYSGQLELTEDNIFAVTAASHILQVTSPLFSQCCDFLIKFLSHDSCFEIMNLATIYPIQNVYDSARRYCLLHFLTLRDKQSFLNLTLHDLRDYLTADHLVADGTWEILAALKNWTVFNMPQDFESLKDVIAACLKMKIKNLSDLDNMATAIMKGDVDFQEHKWAHLGSRQQKKDVFMFWAHLSGTKAKGLVDVIKLGDLETCQELVHGSRFDSMTYVVEDPGFDLGSAVCVEGHFVYLCGGGPSFGRMNWIRDVWVFNAFDNCRRWRAIGKLPETRRYHAMVAIDKILYVFGGFGKFRSKNSSLESFDINDGSWWTLAPMPQHEFKPVATCYHQAIYYITQDWNVYKYSVSSNEWTHCQSLDVHEEVHHPQRGNDLHNPVAIHITSSGLEDSINLSVVSVGQCIRISSFPLRKDSRMSFCHQQNHVKYFGSFSMNGQIYLLLRKDNGEERDNENEDSDKKRDNEINVLSFDPSSGQLKEVTTISNVNKSSSILTLPHVPKSFKINQSVQGPVS